MGRHFDNELRDLKFSLLAMAGQVEEMIALTQDALVRRDGEAAERVLALDKEVDEWELKLDQACIDLLGLRAPFASDLRLLASTLKIVPELERIGDHCCNIAWRAKVLSTQPAILATEELERLSREAQGMVRLAVDAFVNGNAEQARNVIDSDDRADHAYVEMYKTLLRQMLADPLTIERATHLLMINKNWERIADQATNIAEEVLFILEGKSAKHPYLRHS